MCADGFESCYLVYMRQFECIGTDFEQIVSQCAQSSERECGRKQHYVTHLN